jgi:hypothetical protein
MLIKAEYYNSHWNIFIHSKSNRSMSVFKDWIEKETEQVIPYDDEGEFRLRTYSHPEIPCLHSFGLYLFDAKQRPGHGGEWSSRTQIINHIFDVNLMECAVDGIAMAVDRQWLKDLLGDNAKWAHNDSYGEYIVEIKGRDPKNHQTAFIYVSKDHYEKENSLSQESNGV